MSVNTHVAPTVAPDDQRVQTQSFWSRYLLFLIFAVVLAVMILVGGLTTDNFLTFENGLTILRAASITGIVALGMSFVTISGNFFALSLEQTAALTAMVFAICLRSGMTLLPAMLLALAAAVLIGVLQGMLVAAGVNPIVTTLGAGAVLLGLASNLASGTNIRFDSTQADWLGGARPLGVPTQTWVFLIAVALAWWALRRTAFGRTVYLVGANPRTSRGSGFRVAATTTSAFAIAAFTAGIAGIFTAAQFAQVKIEDFSAAATNLDKGGTNINVIAAVLVGGIAVQGGKGSPLMPAFGAIFIALLQNYMNISGFSVGVRYATTGLVVGIAVLALHVARRRAA